MSVIDEIKQKVDIVDVAGQYVRLTKSGRTMRGLCPFHSEKHPSFFVYPDQQSWHCFGACNSGGDVFSFIMKKEGIDFGEALRLLAQRAGVTLSTKAEPRVDEKGKLYQVNQAAAEYFHHSLLHSADGEQARSYIASRSLSLETVTRFQLGYSPNRWEGLKQYLMERGYTEGELLQSGLVVLAEDGKTHDRFRNRLMFPIHDIRGRVVGFGARVLDDSLPKYLNSPQTPVFDKSSSLYGINLAAAAIREQDLAVIVEGYMDVLTAHQNGFTNVVASMGTAINDKKVNVLKRLTRNIALALDADAAGEEAMLRGVSYENILDAEVKVIILPKGKDPDEVIKEDAETWRKLMAEALPIMDYTFNMVTAELDLNTARGKSVAVDRLLPIIAEIKNDTRRDHYLTKLSELTGTKYKELESALGRIKPDRRVQEAKEEVITRALRPVFSSPVEEYFLALLLQHPEVKGLSQQPLPEYFEKSENRQIFVAWQKVNDLSSLKEKLDPAISDYVDYLANKSLPPNQIEEKYADCLLRLREGFLRNLVMKAEAALAAERELGGSPAELAELEEQGIQVSTELREVFAEKARKLRSKGAGK